MRSKTQLGIILKVNLKNEKFNNFLLELKDAAVIKYSKAIGEINNATTSTTVPAIESTANTDNSNSQSSSTQEQLVTPTTK